MNYLDMARRGVGAAKEAKEAKEVRNSRVTRTRSGDTGCEKSELSERSPGVVADAKALGLDPSLRWVHVYRGPVEETPLLAGAAAPDHCGSPNACRVLGPCPHFSEHGRCWAQGGA